MNAAVARVITDQGVSRREAVLENPILADWLFYFCVQKFIEYFYQFNVCIEIFMIGSNQCLHWLLLWLTRLFEF